MKLKAGVFTSRNEKDELRDELVKTNVQIIPVKRGKSFNVGGLSATVEYTSEELRFLQKDQVNTQKNF